MIGHASAVPKVKKSRKKGSGRPQKVAAAQARASVFPLKQTDLLLGIIISDLEHGFHLMDIYGLVWQRIRERI